MVGMATPRCAWRAGIRVIERQSKGSLSAPSRTLSRALNMTRDMMVPTVIAGQVKLKPTRTTVSP